MLTVLLTDRPLDQSSFLSLVFLSSPNKGKFYDDDDDDDDQPSVDQTSVDQTS